MIARALMWSGALMFVFAVALSAALAEGWGHALAPLVAFLYALGTGFLFVGAIGSDDGRD